MAEQHKDQKVKSDDELLANAIPIEPEEDEDAPQPIELEDTDPSSSTHEIRSFAAEKQKSEETWKRKPNVTGQGAVHARTFVSKLRLDAIEHMDHSINEWLDAHPEYEVKMVTTAVGELTGKLKEPALFMTVWV